MIDYTGVQCPVCGKPFAREDDIVVCPECGAPYHRQCYQQEGHCVFQDKHGTAQAWRRQGAPTDSDDKRCPRCGRPNPQGALFCDHCGMSLTEEPPIGPQNNYGQFNSRYGASPPPRIFLRASRVPGASPTDKHRAASPTGRIRTSPSPEVPSLFL